MLTLKIQQYSKVSIYNLLINSHQLHYTITILNNKLIINKSDLETVDKLLTNNCHNYTLII